MSGFRKAKAEQAYLKMSMYGPPGSGKTFTALLIAEGLAAATGKRVAVVDTERGTDFYAQAVPSRTAHPDAFDFDAMHSRSLTEVLTTLRGKDPKTMEGISKDYGVLVIDSISHLWDAAKAAYSGRMNRAGQIPMWAWQGIKAPYKALMQWLINSPMHVLILGRQGTEFAEDEETGESKAVGTKMRAEGETAYEPHICLRMESIKPVGRGAKTAQAVPTAFAEKDRTGVLQGRLIEWPCFANIGEPLLPLLGLKQGQVQTEDEAAAVDAEALAAEERSKTRASKEVRADLEARLVLAKTVQAVEALGKEITPQLKRTLTPADLTGLRESYLKALARAKGEDPDGEAERRAIETT